MERTQAGPINNTLHIIEPTLRDYTGHCHGYVASLLSTENTLPTTRFTIWLERTGQSLFNSSNIQPHFIYKIRKLQLYFLYRRLIANDEMIFTPTAGMIDLRMLAKHLTAKKNFQGSVHLHFHQFRCTNKKQRQLRKIAQRHPNIHILTPTKPLTTPFKAAGFKNITVVPCPVNTPIDDKLSSQTHMISQANNVPPKLLYAGAARRDKGFIEWVEYLEYALAKNPNLRVHVQATPPHNKKYSPDIKQYLLRCQSLNLTMSDQPLPIKEYLALFNHVITMALYDPELYANKFSGIMLESLLHGTPVITTHGTWFSTIIKMHKAGVVIDNREPETIDNAVQQVMKNYSQYRDNAVTAAKVLREKHHPRHTIHAILHRASQYHLTE